MENRPGKLEERRRQLARLLAGLLLAACPSSPVWAQAQARIESPSQTQAQAQAEAEEGRATGGITLNGERVTLTHAYAAAKRGMFDKATEDVQVLLTDAELPDTAREDMFELIHLARDGKITAVEVLIDATGSPIGGAIYAKAFDGMISVAGVHRYAQTRKADKSIAGRLSMDRPSTFMNVTYEYDATFDARIPRPPTAEETAAALASPPARAAAAYVAAVRRGELSAFLATLAPAAAEDYRGADARDRLTQLRTDMPADSRVANLTPQPDGTALATVEGHENGIVIAYELKMVRVGDAWKVGK
jgi:hypothetical protein